MIVDFLRHLFGLDNPSSLGYLFWSGCVTATAFIATAYQHYRHHNCHVHRCWRVGRFSIGPYVVCRKHHPAKGAITTETVRNEHERMVKHHMG